jgi:hypothetical protein
VGSLLKLKGKLSVNKTVCGMRAVSPPVQRRSTNGSQLQAGATAAG